MKTWKLRKFNMTNLCRMFLLLSIVFSGQPQITATAQGIGTSSSDNSFFVRNYGGKCLDFGAAPQVSGTPVFIFDCNGSPAQQVRIEEVNARHDVILRAGNKVIGVNADLVIGSKATTQATGYQEAQIPLELQDEKDRNTILSRGQKFALDGDSIILAMNRNLVVEVQHARGANRTPLVLGKRDLNDAEFWTFTSSDGSNRRPTRGFVRISDDGESNTRTEFLKAIYAARWGTVIEIDRSVEINLTNMGYRVIPAGVTIRGDRRGTLPGPLLKSLSDQTKLRNPYFPNSDWGMLLINGDHVRITGLRLQGPGGDDEFPYANGIATQDQFSALIDHNEIFGWTAAAVYVTSDGFEDLSDPYFSRPQNLRVARNFIHDNNNSGYGVATYGGYPYIEGNTFYRNRHSITASSESDSAYRAWLNLVLTARPPERNWDFDAHGTGEQGCGGCGGTAGMYFEIARNTFLGTDRENFALRGEPGEQVDYGFNISLRSLEDAVACIYCGDIDKLKLYDNNQFNASNPTSRLGVGDFDADGKQDLFLATGAAWYYAPAGKAEWRYLNARTDKITNLLFGDFDNDGRTDVFTQHNYSWDVSWGGASPWETINVSWAILGDTAIGDIIGDERDDVFYSDGQTWQVSDGGVGQFTHLNTSGYRVSRLRFGDFNADGKTDVFSVVDGQWKASYSGISSWQFLRPKLTDSVARLTVADFNGDGRADVATSTKTALPLGSDDTYDWKVSFGGTEPWTILGEHVQSLASVAAIGRFDNFPGVDVLVWNNNYLDNLSVNTGNSLRHSRQDMR
jgi:hypothetical protein